MTSNFSWNILRGSIFSNQNIYTKMASAYMIQLVCQVKYVYNFFFSKAEEQTNDQNTDRKQSENSYSAVNMTNIFNQILFYIII